jgi:imidazolonepropionase-like amidohydrolase
MTMKLASGTTIVRNGRLVDGTGAAAIDRGALFITAGRIVYAGTEAGLPAGPREARTIDARGGTINAGSR